MRRIRKPELEGFVATLFEHLGAGPSAAADVAGSLTGADARGHHSHGVLRAPIYSRMIEDGAIEPRALPTRNRSSETTVHLDGRSAFGQVVGRAAVDAGVSIAKSNGSAVVGIRNGSHLGRIGEWAERAAEDGILFAAFVNHQGGGKTVAPAGSSERRFGTNPMAFGIPTFTALPFPIVHDMATSQVAHGKIREREKTGEPLPDEWTTSEDGTPVKDAGSFERGAGALLPLGGRAAGYKGFGLSVVSELVAGLVGDALIASEADPAWTSNAAGFVFVDPLRFTSRERCEERVESLASYLGETEFSDAVPLGAGAHGTETRLPGEVEYRTRLAYEREGIPFSDGLSETLRTIAAETGTLGHLPDGLRT